MTRDDAAAWCARERAAGRRVAFSNGCFDLLHAGHVTMLAAARGTADALVVGLNSDASVRRLKGPERPLVPETERAELLEALEMVDAVVVYDEDTPLETILALRPDVLIKGADWAEDAIVGAREVRSWGGEVRRIELVPGTSTTTIVARVRERFGRRD